MNILNKINSDDRDTWFHVGSVLKTELGQDGFEAWAEWSKSSDKYDEKESKRQWNSINRGFHSLGHLKKLNPDITLTNKYLQDKNILKAPDDIEVTSDKIVIPVYDKHGNIISHQTIYEAGGDFHKIFDKDKPIKGGRYVLKGFNHSIGKSVDKCVLCEGFATGMTLWKARDDWDVIVCFSVNQIKNILKSVKNKYGLKAIALELDKASEKLENNIDDVVFLKPDIDTDTNDGHNGFDFNDLENKYSIAHVRKFIESYISIYRNDLVRKLGDFKIEDGCVFHDNGKDLSQIMEGSLKVVSYFEIDEDNKKDRSFKFEYSINDKVIESRDITYRELVNNSRNLSDILNIKVKGIQDLTIKRNKDKIINYMITLANKAMEDDDLRIINFNKLGFINDDNFVYQGKCYQLDTGKVYPAHTRDKDLVCIMDETNPVMGDVNDISELPELYKEAYGNNRLAFKFMLCLGAGSLPYSFCSYKNNRGGMVALVSNMSGIGKTEVCNNIINMYGNSDNLSVKGPGGSTSNAFTSLKVALDSIPIYWDDLSVIKENDLNNIVYSSFNTGGKKRHGELKESFKNSRNFVITSSNTSILSRMRSAQQNADGLSARVLELFINYSPDDKIIFTDKERKAARVLSTCHGVVGEIILDYVINNRDRLQKEYDDLYNEFYTEAQDRFINNFYAAAIIGCRIASKLNIFYFSEREIRSYIDVLKVQRKEDKEDSDEEENPLSLLKDIIISNHHNINEGLEFIPKSPIQQPMIFNDMGKYFITSRALKYQCGIKGYDYSYIIKSLENAGILSKVSKNIKINKQWITTRCIAISAHSLEEMF